METQTDVQVSIWLREKYQEVDTSFTYKNGSNLAFNDYVDACRRAALAFGYSENLVKDTFGE